MESSLLADHQARRLTTGKNFNSGSNSPTFSPSQSLSYEQQQKLLFLLQSQAGGGGSNGGFGFFSPSHPPPFFPNSNLPIPPLPTRSSLPPIPRFQFQSQLSRVPPLLPLPFTRSQSLPSTFTSPPVMSNRKGSSNNNQRKNKPGTGSRRKPSKESGSGSNPTASANTPPPPLPPVTKAVEVEDQKEEGEIDDDEEKIVYSLSPPPSSLPLPTFTLRPRNGVDCNVEALGVSAKAGGGGRTAEIGNRAGALPADDLRRLFRL